VVCGDREAAGEWVQTLLDEIKEGKMDGRQKNRQRAAKQSDKTYD
jgi:hypothetical protein